jgi:hypothetical protein
VSFGDQQVGTTSASKNGTLTNSGTDTLHISNVAITGTNAGDFAIVVGPSTTCTNNSTVNATANCTWAVTFTPTATGARAASLSFTDDATGSPQSVTLSGNGTAPAVSLAPASVDFGIQAVGTTSAAKNGTLTNTGTATLHISNVAITGTNAGDFAIVVGPSTTCTNGSTVAPNNGTCAWAVTFTPSAAGTRTASLSFTDDAAGSPQSVALTGATPPVASLSTNSINFNNQGVNTTSAVQTVTVTNSGGSALNINGIALSGPNPGDFAITSNGSGACTNTSSVAAGSNCSINLTFTPTATGNRAATLSITDNAAGSPQTVSLAGTGIDFSVAGPSSPVTTTAGQPVMVTITVTPGANGFPNPVAFSASNLPPLSSASFSPSSVTPMGAAATTTLTINTKRRVAEPVKGNTLPPLAGPAAGLWLFSVALVLLTLVMLRRVAHTQRSAVYLGVALLLCCGVILSGCSNSAAGTPKGNYSVTVTATSGQLQHSVTVNLMVQ